MVVVDSLLLLKHRVLRLVCEKGKQNNERTKKNTYHTLHNTTHTIHRNLLKEGRKKLRKSAIVGGEIREPKRCLVAGAILQQYRGEASDRIIPLHQIDVVIITKSALCTALNVLLSSSRGRVAAIVCWSNLAVICAWLQYRLGRERPVLQVAGAKDIHGVSPCEHIVVARRRINAH